MMSLITGLTLVAVYVDDLKKALEFYEELLGLQRGGDMGENAVYLMVSPDIGLYLEGGNAPASAVTPRSVRASFALTTESASQAFAVLRDAGVRMVHTGGPSEMGGGQFWFQCYDPAGNLIELVGPR